MSIQIEAAESADGDGIGEILSRWIDDTDWMPRIHTREQDIGHGHWLLKMCAVTVARSSTGVSGFLARQGAEIQALYIAPSAHGQGLGSALLNQAMEQSTRLSLWSFQANTGALAFYTRHGFFEVRRTDGAGNDEKLSDVRLIWESEKND